MKKLVLAITIAAMAIGGTAIADTYMDNIGVYFDEEATSVCVPDVGLLGVNSAHHAYVVLTKATELTVKGFELKLLTEGPLNLLGASYPDAGAINVGTEPVFVVGYSEVLPIMNRTFILMDFFALVTNLNPVFWSDGKAYLYVTELDFPSIDEPLPAYLTGEENLIPMHQSTGTENNPAAIFVLDGMCDPVVAVDQTSFDGLKSLYR
jgi:hypothetical protein